MCGKNNHIYAAQYFKKMRDISETKLRKRLK